MATDRHPAMGRHPDTVLRHLRRVEGGGVAGLGVMAITEEGTERVIRVQRSLEMSRISVSC